MVPETEGAERPKLGLEHHHCVHGQGSGKRTYVTQHETQGRGQENSKWGKRALLGAS